ncbi:MAG TPA: YggT family protein [Nostocaceae cyanobacterium]|nr:YggT family protein [Nostocaceae cyanobacterium]
MLAIQVLSSFIQLYTFLLLIRVALTWFPNINWYNQPFTALAQLTDPYLDLFRSIIPPFSGVDLSPMLAIFALQIIGGLLSQGLGRVAVGF